MYKRRFKIFSWSLFLFYFTISFFLIFGKQGMIAYYKLQQRSEKLTKKIQNKKKSETVLRRKKEALSSNDEFYQSIIKDKLLYIKDNEVIIFFPKKK